MDKQSFYEIIKKTVLPSEHLTAPCISSELIKNLIS